MLKRISTTLCPSLQKAIENDPLLLDSAGFRKINRVLPEILVQLARRSTSLPYEKVDDDYYLNELVMFVVLYSEKIDRIKALGRAEVVINFQREDDGYDFHFIVRLFKKNVARAYWVLTGKCSRDGCIIPIEIIRD